MPQPLSDSATPPRQISGMVVRTLDAEPRAVGYRVTTFFTDEQEGRAFEARLQSDGFVRS